VGSFVVALWVTDREGNLQATSDTMPLSEIRQHFTWPDGQRIPGIYTETKYYQALWSAIGHGRWRLDLKAQADAQLLLVIRSVVPAGGPIRSLSWEGQQLSINDRWAVSIDPVPVEVHLSEEGAEDWMTDNSSVKEWQSDRGWGYTRINLGGAGDWHIVIEDSMSAAPHVPLNAPAIRPTPNLTLPDERFSACLNAQIAHLMMSLVDRQTRPGDPLNYPLAWLRDGAYVVVALARAGQLEVARELSAYFAENDFFGGFGPEADGPGIAIWALEEIAVRQNQPEYDQWLWPHVRRKAEIILEMLSAERPIHRPITGPIVPRLMRHPNLFLVAEPARDGLIVGRMDQHRPLL
jgi:hypothetical protein